MYYGLLHDQVLTKKLDDYLVAHQNCLLHGSWMGEAANTYASIWTPLFCLHSGFFPQTLTYFR